MAQIAGNATILLVDDDARCRYLNARLLRGAGYEVREATQGSQALEMLSQERPDLVILDVLLPGMPGSEVLQQIRSDPATSAIPVMYLSAAFADDAKLAHGLEEGADAYLSKLASREVLLAQVKALLRVGQMHQALRESEERYRSLFELTPDLVIVHDAGRIEFINQAGLRLLGASREDELIGKSVIDFVHPNDRESVRQRVGAIMHRTGRAPTAEERLLRLDGGVISAEVTAVGVTLGGEPRVLVMAHDITERKRAEEEQARLLAEVQQQRTLLDAVIQTMPAGVSIVDAQGRVVLRNEMAQRITGLPFAGSVLDSYRGDASPRRPDGTPYLPEDIPGVRVLRTGEVVVHEQMTLTRAGGEEVVLSINAAPLRDAAGSITGGVTVFQNITARVQAEQARRESEETLQQANEELEVANEELMVTNQQLRESEEALRRQASLLDLSYEAIFAWELEGGIISWNRGAQALYGYGPDEAIGHISHDLLRTVFPDGREALLSALTQAKEWAGELTHITKDGRTLVVESRHQVVEDGSGRHIVLEINRDMTARKQAEQALRESEERFRGLFETMQEGFALHEIICDAEGRPVDYRFLEVNPAFERLTGLRREAAIGRTVLEVLPGTEPYWVETYGRVALTGEPARLEQYAASLGRYYEAFAYSPQRGQFAVIFSDVTARRQAEEALRESEEQFRTLADSIPNLTWWANGDGYITWYNRRWYDYTGTTPEQMEGWGWQSVHDPEVLPAVLKRWQASIATGEPFEMTFPLRGADGRFRDFLTRVYPLKDAQGRVLRWFGTNTDVSALRLAEERALQAERARADIAEQMTAEINHRMKNNLTMISGVLEMQTMAEPAGSPALHAIRDAITRLTALSVVHEQLYDAKSARIELRDVLRRIGDVDAQFLAANNASLSVTGDEVYVSSRLGSTLALLANELISNALQYGAPGKSGKLEVEISLSRQPEGLRLRVWGSGNPVPEDFRVAGQVGLGLSLVEGVVARQLQGSLTVRPDRGGTLAEVTIPERELTAPEYVPRPGGSPTLQAREQP